MMPTLPDICWVVVDGLPMWLVERHVVPTPGRYPTLSRVLRAGQMARLVPVSPNCQTPPSLCTLFSGAGPETHGLTGFDVPDERDPVAKRNAFEAFSSDVPMIWDRYASAGQGVALSHIPYVSAERLGSALKSQSYGFIAPTIAPASFAIRKGMETHAIPGAEVQITIHTQLDGSIWIENKTLPSEDSRTLLALDEWTPITLVAGVPTLACVCQGNDGATLHILGTQVFTPTGQNPDQIGPRYPFVVGGLAQIFRKGGFGRPMIDGGDGRAEKVLLRGVCALAKRFWAEAILGAASQDAAFTLAYQPAYDLLFHEVLGLVDPDNGHCTPDRARLADALLADALAEIDCGLAAVIGAAKGRRCVMCSDHGMKPVDTILCPNVLLKDWGHLKTKAGSIDAKTSTVFFHPAETGAVWFAKTVPPDAQKEILDRLTSTFTDLTGQASHWFEAQVQPNGSENHTQHYFFAPGKGQTSKAHLDGPAIRPSRKTADHATFTEEDSLHGVVASLTHKLRLPDCIAAEHVAQAFTQEAIHGAH